jgi:hypothetical protein
MSSEDDEIRELLIRAMPPIGRTVPNRDLWPDMVRRMRPQSLKVHWWEWALAGAVPVWIALFPNAFLALLFHL